MLLIDEYGPFGGYPSEKYSRSQAGVYKDAKYAPTHVGQVDYKVINIALCILK